MWIISTDLRVAPEFSLAVFSPQPVITFLARPEHHVEATDPTVSLDADQWHNVQGYRGLYNFRHPFWVVKGSRVYPPVPHLSLNIAQDLSNDVAGNARRGVPIG